MHRLPDNEAMLRLLDAAREAYRIPAGVDIIAVPGTEAAIRQLPGILPTGKTAIVGPTYGSYAAGWRNAAIVASLADIDPDVAVAIAVNPNNPDGRLTPFDNIPGEPFLVVDEAFADLSPGISFIPELRGRRAIVLRSLGKFFGLAGVRLGFVVGPQAACAHIAARFGAWPVSGPAIVAGIAALSDRAWQERTRAHLQVAAGELRALLAANDLPVIGGTDLFILVEADDAHGLHRRLAGRGVWTRAFADQTTWLRVGLPGADGKERLSDALRGAR
jgi:cobalamin biosynthetic protein CobC